MIKKFASVKQARDEAAKLRRLFCSIGLNIYTQYSKVVIDNIEYHPNLVPQFKHLLGFSEI